MGRKCSIPSPAITWSPARIQRQNNCPAHRRTVDGSGISVRLFRVRNRLFPTIPFAQRFPGLLPAIETVVAVRRRPCGQNREGFPARAAAPAANPDPVVPLIVRLLAPSAVTNDGPIAADGTPSRQQLQRERGHPGSILFSFSGSAIKRIKAGVKARS